MAKGFSSINLTMCSTIIMALTSCNVQEPASPSNALAGSVTANGLTYEIISGNDLRNTIAEHKLVRIPKIHDLARIIRDVVRFGGPRFSVPACM